MTRLETLMEGREYIKSSIDTSESEKEYALTAIDKLITKATPKAKAEPKPKAAPKDDNADSKEITQKFLSRFMIQGTPVEGGFEVSRFGEIPLKIGHIFNKIGADFSISNKLENTNIKIIIKEKEIKRLMSVEVPKMEAAPKEEPRPESASKLETAPRTPKEVPAGKDPLAHCKDVLAEFRNKQKGAKIKAELLADAKGDEKKIAEIAKMNLGALLEAAPEKPALSVPQATKAKLLSLITFNVRQKVAKQKISAENMKLINERVAEITERYYEDLDNSINNMIKNTKK